MCDIFTSISDLLYILTDNRGFPLLFSSSFFFVQNVKKKTHNVIIIATEINFQTYPAWKIFLTTLWCQGKKNKKKKKVRKNINLHFEVKLYLILRVGFFFPLFLYKNVFILCFFLCYFKFKINSHELHFNIKIHQGVYRTRTMKWVRESLRWREKSCCLENFKRK